MEHQTHEKIEFSFLRVFKNYPVERRERRRTTAVLNVLSESFRNIKI